METQFYIAATLWIMLILNRIYFLSLDHSDKNKKINFQKDLSNEVFKSS